MSPQFEKLTEDNARLAAVFLDAWLLTGQDVYRDRATRTIEYMRKTLLDPETGLFGLAQYADEEYHSKPPKNRTVMRDPGVA